MIIWLNGAFGSGKTTLTEELHRRLPDAVIFDPEYVGYVLTQAVPAPTGDYQDLPAGGIWLPSMLSPCAGSTRQPSSCR